MCCLVVLGVDVYAKQCRFCLQLRKQSHLCLQLRKPQLWNIVAYVYHEQFMQVNLFLIVFILINVRNLLF